MPCPRLVPLLALAVLAAGPLAAAEPPPAAGNDARGEELLASAIAAIDTKDLARAIRDARACTELAPPPAVLGRCLRTLGILHAKAGASQEAVRALRLYLPMCEAQECERIDALVARFQGGPAAGRCAAPADQPPPAGAPDWVVRRSGLSGAGLERTLAGVGFAPGSKGAQASAASEACARAELRRRLLRLVARLSEQEQPLGQAGPRRLRTVGAAVLATLDDAARTAPVPATWAAPDGSHYALSQVAAAGLQARLREAQGLEPEVRERIAGRVAAALDALAGGP